MARPKLVADAGMDTHILFTRVGLNRLKRRISELVQENKAERNNFKARTILRFDVDRTNKGWLQEQYPTSRLARSRFRSSWCRFPPGLLRLPSL